MDDTPRRRGRPGGDERAVSDAIGFVFVFSLIVVSIGLVSVAGFNALDDMRTAEQLQNAERTFETVERNFDDIERRHAPSRAAEVNLNGGTILVDESSSVRVNVTGADFDRTVDAGILSYRIGNQRVEYENGAVVRTSDGASVVLTDANIECGEDVAFISVVTLEGSDVSITGSDVVAVHNKRVNTSLAYPTNRTDHTADGVEIEVSSPNADGWNRYLDDADGWSDPDGDGTYTCTRADEVFVRITEFRLSFLS